MWVHYCCKVKLVIWTPKETEESVLISEVAYFLGVKCE